MKKRVALAPILTLLLIFSGCGAKNANDNMAKENPVSQLPKIQDYFPSKENVRYVYQGQGNEYASYYAVNDFTTAGKLQQRVNNGGTESIKVYEIKDGKLTRVLTRGEAYYRENLLGAKPSEDEVLLMEPLTIGTKWNIKGGEVRTITGTAVALNTPSGSYQTIEVTTQGPDDQTLDYYAKNIGLVKTVFKTGGSEVSSTLSKIEENVPFTQKIKFYYPNINDGKIYFKSVDVSFKTNDITRKVLGTVYKDTVSQNVGKVLTTNTTINSLYLNQDGIVYLDLSSDFLKEINAGSGYEAMILQCLANTFGEYYHVSKVVLTIDNKLYESGHIAMKKGEYLSVKTEGTVEIK